MFLEFKHLRTLVTIRESGNLASAAKQLHQTQSALSHQLKSIESYYETQLFTRKSKPVHFTKAGQKLLELADAILPLISRTERELQCIVNQNQGRLHIAMECHSCFEWLMPTMDIYRSHWPEVEMDISIGFAFEPMPALRHGQVDFVITSDPRNLQDIHFEPLFTYNTLLAISKTHSLINKKYIDPEDLRTETLITYPVSVQRLDIYKDFLTPAGLAPVGRRTAELTAMILQLVANNQGVAALPDWALNQYIEQGLVSARPLGQKGLTYTLYAAIRKSEQSLPYLKAFLAQAKETAPQVLAGIFHPSPG